MSSDNKVNQIINRSIIFLKQQQEMYGDFETHLSSVLTASTSNPKDETQSVSEPLEVQKELKINKPTSPKIVSTLESKTKIELNYLEEIEKCNSLEELRILCDQSEELRTDLADTNLVFGVGNPNADLLIVGEAPGANEDKVGEPFVGRAGQLLDKIMEAINFSRDKIYIANILKHRPPENRDPTPAERKRSLPYLKKQIELVNPKLILCVGRISGTTLLGEDDTLKNMRQKLHPYLNAELMVTYHPAALLRNPNWKRPTWEDVQMLRKRYDELGGKP